MEDKDIQSKQGQDTTTMANNLTKGFLYFKTSLQEWCRYMKAFFVGQGKKMRARSEEEATEADMVKAKMEVDAADAAENTKKQLNKST